MSGSPQRYSVNPVELIIFATVFLVFANSVYRLFFGWDEIRVSLKTEATAPAGRRPAGITRPDNLSFENLEYHCSDAAQRFDITAGRARLKGPLCGLQELGAQGSLIQAQVLNTGNQVKAQVFTNLNAGNMQTDFIPLMEGVNPIEVRLKYSNNQERVQRLEIHRRAATAKN